MTRVPQFRVDISVLKVEYSMKSQVFTAELQVIDRYIRIFSDVSSLGNPLELRFDF